MQDNSRNERLMLLLPHRDILKRTRMMNTKQRYVIHGGGSGSISGVASMLSSGTENSETLGYSEILECVEILDTENWKQESWMLLSTGDWKLESWMIL